MRALPSELRSFLVDLWLKQIEAGVQPDLSLAAECVSTNPQLNATAIGWVIEVAAESLVHSRARARLLPTASSDPAGPSDSPSLVTRSVLVSAMVKHGMGLMDLRFGAKKLGDFLPSEAVVHADYLATSGRTMLIRASFIKAAAALCAVANVPIREQVSEQQLMDIRARLLAKVPDAEAAETALVIA